MKFIHHFKDKFFYLAIIGLVIFIAVRCSFFEVKIRTPDETQYQFYADAISNFGFIDGSRVLMVEYRREQWRWHNPPPSRIGHVFLTAIASDLLKKKDELPGSIVSLITSMLLAVCAMIASYLLTRSWFAAFITLLLLAFSNWEIALSRRSWTDGTIATISAMIFCLLIYARKYSNFLVLVTYSALSGISLLFKESGPILSGLMLLILLIPINYKNYFSVLKFFLAWLFGIICSYLVITYFMGSFDDLFFIAARIAEAVPNALYAKKYQDGNPFVFIKSFYVLAPGFLFLLLSAFFVFLLKITKFEKKLTEIDFITIAVYLMTAFLVISASIPLYYKNLRYLSPLIVPLYVVSSVNLYMFFKKSVFNCSIKNNWILNIIYFCIVIVFVTLLSYDYFNFIQLKSKNDLIDLNYRLLLERLY